MAEVWRRIISSQRRAWGRGYEHVLECGHTEIREQKARTQRMICMTCSTPPEEQSNRLDRPRTATSTQLAALGRELERLATGAVVANTPAGTMIVSGRIKPSVVVDVEETLRSLRQLTWQALEVEGPVRASDAHRRPPTPRVLAEAIGRELERLGVDVTVSATAGGSVVMEGHGAVVRLLVSTPLTTLRALQQLDWQPTAEELVRLVAGDADGEEAVGGAA